METVAQALAALDAAVDAVVSMPAWQLAEPELAAVLVAVEVAGRRLSGAALGVIDEVDERGVPSAADVSSAAASRRASDTAGWLRGLLALAPADARQRVVLASWLNREGVCARDALRAGRVGLEQVQVVARTMRRLHPDVDIETRAEALKTLLDHAGAGGSPDDGDDRPHDGGDSPDDDVDEALDDCRRWSGPLRGFDPHMLARVASRLRHRLDPDAGERLAKDQDRWEELNEFTVSVDKSGRGHLTGVLDPVSTGTLLAALDPLAKPRPATDGGWDDRSPGLRRAQALMVIVGTVLGLPEGTAGALAGQAGARPRMMVIVPWDTFTAHLSCRGGSAGVAPAVTGTGQVLSARTIEQLACIGEIVPVLLDPDGCPLDVGQSVYAFPDRIRRAIEARDHGCTFPGCSAPAPWCHSHHLVPYSRGGATSLANGTLLCGRHHRFVHAGGWTGSLIDRRVTWHPPGRGRPRSVGDLDTVAGEHGERVAADQRDHWVNGEHEPLQHVRATLDSLTRRWIARNPHLRQRAG